jgi:hypothetical protein
MVAPAEIPHQHVCATCGEGLHILEGEPLDKRLRQQVEALKHCLHIAGDALAWHKDPVTRQAMRSIRRHLDSAGIRMPGLGEMR